MDILLSYIHGMADGLKTMPGIYASAHFLNAIFTDTTPLKDLLYWVAHYNVSAPDVQSPFKEENPPFIIWQAFENAVLKAIEGGKKAADLNFFYGTQADFNRLFG